jgi:two-component system chemotaxis sensor kinase CheA
MVPVRSAFQKMARMVRDLSHKDHKKVRAVVSGEWTEMDRSMVEQIADPMVHMVRNSISHGIETPAERVQAGKPETASVYLSAYHQGAGIVIEVADDGRGLDAEAILAKARSKGLVGPDEHLAESEIYNLIFAPGFSTAKKVTEIAGRGVGMDVVRRNIDAMRGKISISSTPGQGCSFKMVLPLTLAIIDGMIVACGEEKYIIPTLSIVESVRPTADMVFSMVGSRDVVTIRDDTLPLLRLDHLFDIPDAQRDPTAAQVVVLDTPAGQVGLLVDDVLAQQQVVIKRLDVTVAGGRFLSGAAILSDGLVGLILNVDELHALASGRSARSHSVVCHDAAAAGSAQDPVVSGQGDAR